MKTTSTQKNSDTKNVENEVQEKLNDLSEVNQKQLQNIFQHVPAATAVLEGPEHKYILANKAYQKLFKRKAKDFLGRSIHEVFPELKDTGAFDLVDRVFETGESYTTPEYVLLVDAHNDGVLRQNFYEFSMEALKNDLGEIYAVIAMIYDITEQVELRKKIEENEKKQAFLLKLSDALRTLRNPVEIEGSATKMALDFMDADRCLYVTIEGDNAIILRDAVRKDLPSLVGVYPFSSFALFKAVMDAGHHFIVDDVNTTDIIDEDLKQLCLKLQLISMISVPVIKSGKLMGILSLVQSKPRKWTASDVLLTIEVAERTWVKIEKVKSEETLRISEEKYRTLFTSMDQGFTLCELIRNTEGKAIDFYMLEVNPTYEKQTGVSKDMVLGKALLQVFPSLYKWLDNFEVVVDNQCSVVFENYLEETDSWFAIKAYPVEKERFAVLFSNITERKLAETKLIESERAIREIKEQLELSIRAGKIGVWFWDVKKDILIWSNEQKELYGFNASALITSAAQFNALIFPEDLNRIQFDQSNSNISDHEYDFRIRRKNDGEVRWIKSRARNSFDPQGVLQSISGVNIDVTDQVLALNKIQESENRFRNMADASPVLIWTLDANGGSSYYNKTFLDFIGPSKGADISDWKKIVHPDDFQFTFDTINTAIAKNSSYTLKCRLLRADGQWRWVLCQGNPRIGSNNEFLGFVGSGADLTEQKETEEALELQKQMLESVTENTDMALFLMNEKQFCLYMNHAAEKMTGFTLEELKGKQLHYYIHHSHPDGSLFPLEECPIDKALPSQNRIKGEEVFVHKDGFFYPVAYTASPIIFNGIALGTVIEVKETTEDKKKEQELKASESRFRDLAETLPQMVWVMNDEGIMEYGSKNWKEYSGIDDVMKAWNYMMHPNDRERLIAHWNQVFAQGNGYHHEVRLKNKEGIYRWFNSVGEPVLDAEGTICKWVGSLTDIQAQKNIEEMLETEVAIRTKELKQKNVELHNMNKELEAFNYISSHDLQEPLRKIQTFAGRIIAKEKDLSDTAKDYFNRMQNAATRMQTLIQDLLFFSKVNKSERKFEITGIGKMIDEVKEEFKEVIKEKYAIVKATELCEVTIIPFQFRQLIHNLISNALKFSKIDVPPRIIIKSLIASGLQLNNDKLLPEAKYCHISFADNGIGFDTIFSERIFGVFQKLHNKEEYAGTGIGLAIVKKIVDNHNGFITVESELGIGTTFNIYLPV